MHRFDTPFCPLRFKKLIPPHEGDFNVSHHVAESVFPMPSPAFKFFFHRISFQMSSSVAEKGPGASSLRVDMAAAKRPASPGSAPRERM